MGKFYVWGLSEVTSDRYSIEYNLIPLFSPPLRFAPTRFYLQRDPPFHPQFVYPFFVALFPLKVLMCFRPHLSFYRFFSTPPRVLRCCPLDWVFCIRSTFFDFFSPFGFVVFLDVGCLYLFFSFSNGPPPMTDHWCTGYPNFCSFYFSPPLDGLSSFPHPPDFTLSCWAHLRSVVFSCPQPYQPFPPSRLNLLSPFIGLFLRP